jgi:hypothetical protein
VASWPQPASARGLRGFLGLAGYYRRFIKDFGTVATPLTQLLCKDSFHWSDDATAAFTALETALTTTSVLDLPDFTKAIHGGLRRLRHWLWCGPPLGRWPLEFYSKPFATRHMKVATYERELIGLVQAVRHWRPYLWGRRFVMRTNHYTLKYMLDQRLSTVP